MYYHYAGEGYDVASLLCPIPFHVRWNKICLNQAYTMCIYSGPMFRSYYHSRGP